MKVLIVGGKGKVGQELARQLQIRGHQTECFGSADPRETFQSRLTGVDAVGITIDTRDTGEAACSYILEAVSAGVPVATGEKGSSAYHFEKLEPHRLQIGFTAILGGGSGMLEFFRHPHDPLVSMAGVINGTLNFIFSRVERGALPEQAIREAQDRGLCEPGVNGFIGMMRAEYRDITLKLCGLFGHSGICNEYLKPEDFNDVFLSEVEILRLLCERKYRFVVRISSHPIPRQTLDIWARKGKWYIGGGFVTKDSVDFPLPPDEQNILVLDDCFGNRTTITGLGAGPKPTAAAMVNDLLRLTSKSSLKAYS